jgi:cell wall assembly regulator SMI1
MLRGPAGPPPPPPPPPSPPPVLDRGPQPVSGRRALLWIGVIVGVVLLAICASYVAALPSAVYQSIDTDEDYSIEDYRPYPIITVPVPTDPRPSAVEACPPTGRVTVTRPDAAMTDRVDRAWLRIEKWLAANAPASARALRPGATAGSVDAVQRRMSVAFPPDLVASLRRHDGMSTGFGILLPPSYVLASADEIHPDWRANCDVLSEQGADPLDEWWNRQFVPFAFGGGGGSLVVDQRPGSHGRVGEFHPDDGTSFEGRPPSFVALLERTATSLETGRPDRPHVNPDGLLTWD